MLVTQLLTAVVCILLTHLRSLWTPSPPLQPNTVSLRFSRWVYHKLKMHKS